MDDLSANFHRLDWGLGNPNKTATLIVCLMVGTWALPVLYRKTYWIALAGFGLLGWCLIATGSRGGIVGLVCGCLPLLVWNPILRSKIHLVAIVVVTALLLIAGACQPHSRFATLGFNADASVSNRFLIWQQVPAMIKAAPEGWGLGRSGDAYMQWFQPLSHGEGYRTLVSSHLTWLVELGWPGRICYIFLWISCFVLLWPYGEQRWLSIPLGIWIAFGVCASFSSVAESKLIWLLPEVALLSCLYFRVVCRQWPSMARWKAGLLVGSIGLLIILAQIVVGAQKIQYRDGVVTIGSESPRIFIIAPDTQILGEHYGHQIREAVILNTKIADMGIGVTPDSERAEFGSILVFSGKISDLPTSMSSGQLIAINPPPDSSMVLAKWSSHRKIDVLVGEFSMSRGFWKTECINRHWEFHIVRGQGEYIEKFVDEVAERLGSK